MKNLSTFSKVGPKRGSKVTDLCKQAQIRLPKDYPWKVMQALSADLMTVLNPSDYENLCQIIRQKDFLKLKELSKLWGLQDMNSQIDIHPAVLRAKYQVSSLLKKFQFPTDSHSRKDAAIKKFILGEISCAQFNRAGLKSLIGEKDTKVREIFNIAQLWIERVIGEFLPDESHLSFWSRHGPGATIDTEKGNTAAYFKYSQWPYSVTPLAFRYAKTLIQNDERWIGALEDSYRERFSISKTAILDQKSFWSNVLRIVPGNKITFVPKTAEIDRSIAIEPTMNLYLQLGVDGFIRTALKKWDVDLNDQTKNQGLAKQGSLDDSDESYCTLDLSMASDTISKMLCYFLLPPDWYNYLMDLRSPSGNLEGIRTFKYEKISSMGNGYTFALESLIFSALSFAVQKYETNTFDSKRIAVYGDDIIIAKKHTVTLIDVLEKAGFKINTDKSFLEGPIRESCGADWFQGKPVRPVSLRTQPTELNELFVDRNRLVRMLALRFGLKNTHCESLYDSWIPSKFKTLVGPLSNEDFDSYLHDPNFYKKCEFRNGLFRFKRLVKVSKKVKVEGLNFLFLKLQATLRPKRSSNFADLNTSYYQRLLTSLGLSQPVVTKWEKIVAGGSCFDVQAGNRSYIALQFSRTSRWCEEYVE